MHADAPLHERIAATELTPRESQVAAFMSSNPGVVAVSSTAEIGAFTSTSDATVVRTSKKLGYASFRELRHSALALSGRHRDPSKVLDDQLGQVSATSRASTVLRDTAALLLQLDAELDPGSYDRAVDALRAADRVMSFGFGPSGSLAEYFSISLRRIGVRASSVTTTGLRLADDLLDLGSGDVVVLFATLRRFREIDVLIDHAREVGATSVLVSETLGEALRNDVDVVLSTPQTITGTSDGVVVGIALAHALELSVGAKDQAGAVQSMERLNELRARIVGRHLDADS